MKRFVWFALCQFILVSLLNAQTTVTIGGGGADYSTLNAAIADINNGSLRGDIVFQITGSTTETSSTSLSASGGRVRYTSLTIYPTGTGYSISGNLNNHLFNLRGADNVTIDGRVNATGSTIDLEITNTNTGFWASTIKLRSDAENNTIQYCTIKGSSNSSFGGIIYFGRGRNAGGNSGNTITRCNITSSASGRPYTGIFSYGKAGRENINNTISYNNFYDLWSTDISSYYIELSSNTSDWTISNNSFYETSSFIPSGNYNYSFVYIDNTSGNNFTISDNFFGGQEASCGGAAFTKTNASNSRLYAIYFNGGTTTASSIQNNTIKNIYWANSGSARWSGIRVEAGDCNIGTVTGNTIGASTGLSWITVSAGASGADVHGIRILSTGTVVCQNNTIGALTAANASGTDATDLYAIRKEGAGQATISSNNIGSTSTANSLQCTSASSGNDQNLFGIYSEGTGTTVISNNTISNLTNSGTNDPGSTSFHTAGIGTYLGANTISGNSIYTISSAANNTCGIVQQSTTGANQSITSNTLYSITNTHASDPTNVYGIYYDGAATGTQSVTGNFIHSLDMSTTDITGSVAGIGLSSGTVTCANNIISLGTGVTDNYILHGIYSSGTGGQTNSILYNTVYLAGSPSGTTANTSCYFAELNAGNADIRNNIFSNERSGGSSGQHYAISIPGVSGLTIDYNDYYASGTGGVIGLVGALDKTTLAAWQSTTSQDANSLNTDPTLLSAGSTTASDYLATASLPGVTGTGVTDDYNSVNRGTSPLMGALEVNDYTWVGTISTDFGTGGNWSGGSVPAVGSNIEFIADPANHCVLDQDRTASDIINAQSTDRLVLNGYTLTLIGDLTLSNGAQVDATASSSEINFNGSSAQSIPSGAFLNDSVDALTINNANGVSLAGDLAVNQALTLTDGDLSIGANTLSLYGPITISSGTLTGGASSNITFGGSGASTDLPEITLNNLTLDRANGINLTGDVTVGGTLGLTNGTLTVGANTLTLSGNQPTNTSGIIDASNGDATLAITSSSAITLSSSTLNTTLNNLTINGSGGLTLQSDYTLSDTLALTSANASSTKGTLDMWDGASETTLSLGANTICTGIGDVTGIVKRTSISLYTTYTFGNPYLSVYFPDYGTIPTEISMKISIGSGSWKTGSIDREVEIIQTGASNTLALLHCNYLHSEFGSNDEESLVYYFKDGDAEYGHSMVYPDDNYVALSHVDFDILSTSFDDVNPFTFNERSAESLITWDGSESTVWSQPLNWTPSLAPSSNKIIIIPDATTTTNDPTLPALSEIRSLTINSGGILNSDPTAELTINGGVGAWVNNGVFNPNTSEVIFTNDTATVGGTTDFYDVTIATGYELWLLDGSTMRIEGTLANNGILHTLYGATTTVEYNGSAQTVVVPNSSTNRYNTLILSGSGTKTMPSSELEMYGDLTVSGTATLSAADNLTVQGDVFIDTIAAFSAGAYHHQFQGDFDNEGTFTAPADDTITFNGSAAQAITGSAGTTFDLLILDNSAGITLYDDITTSDGLTLTSGTLTIDNATLGINGTLTKTSGVISASGTSSLSFGGGSSLTLPDDVFATAPTLNNITVNQTGSVTLGNQNMEITGALTLTAGTFDIDDQTLTLSGSSPARTSGTLDVSDAAATLVMDNASSITLPSSIFTSTVNDLTISGFGGVVSAGAFTLNGDLTLGVSNPSATVGLLDMWDGGSDQILTLGSNATITGEGDVTGIVRRTSFVASTAYTFGHELTTITFESGGTYPTDLQAQIDIGTVPAWKSDAIARTIDFKQTGGSGCTATIRYHYLDSELNSNTEDALVQWAYEPGGPTTVEFGKSAFNDSLNWVETSQFDFDTVPTSFTNQYHTLSETDVTPALWDGSESTDWSTADNWTPSGVPGSISVVTIPDAATTLNSPTLPASAEIKTLTLESSSILNGSASAALTINGNAGAWSNDGGTFNYSTSDVIFSGTSATISGTTDFYDLSVGSGADLSLSTDANIGVFASLTNDGTIDTDPGGATTVDYKGGAQTVVVPDASTDEYYHLILSGSGTKTMPGTALTINGNMEISGSAAVSGNEALTIVGDLTINSSASLTTGAYTDQVAGNFYNYGTLTATGGTFEFNGSVAQEIHDSSATTFNNVTINNTSGAILYGDQLTTMAGNLTINNSTAFELPAGKQLTVSGTLTNSSDSTGLVLRSTDAGTASIINSTSGVEATSERYMTGNRWHIISPSVTDQNIPGFLTDAANNIPTKGTDYGMMRYLESGATNGWDYFTTSTTGTLSAGKGYLTRHTSDDAVTMYGDLAAATTNQTIYRNTNGWNAIGNPFPSSIGVTVDASSSENFLDYNGAQLDPSWAVLYLWDEPDPRVSGVNYYKVISNAGYSGSRPTLNQDYIQPGQAFLVKSKTGGGTVSFTTNMKVHEGTASFFKSTKSNWPGITIKLASKSKSATTDITFYRNMTNGLDITYDAGLYGGDPNFKVYTHLVEDNGNPFMLQCLPDDNPDSLIIPIGIILKYTDSVTFTTEYSELPAGYYAFLEDRLLGTFIDMQKPDAKYTIKLGKEDSGIGRFYLHAYDIYYSGNRNFTHSNYKIYANDNYIVVEGKIPNRTDAYLYDQSGRLIKQYLLEPSYRNELNRDEFKDGIYILRLIGQGVNNTSKLILN